MNTIGELVVVGTGIQLGRHMSHRVLSEIRHAEVVFALADAFTQDWLNGLRPDLQSLVGYYDDDKDRRDTYREMEEAIVEAVRAGQRVCAVFYGHPGVFSQVSHAAMHRLKDEGFPVRMEPGISAEACLYADLGMDPGRRGVQSMEATQFLAYRHTVDPAALLLLWQVALSGNLDCVGFTPRSDRLEVLVDKLGRWYPMDTDVILYEAATLPIEDFRAERMPLSKMPQASYNDYTTLVIPPSVVLERDPEYWDRLQAIRS